MGTSLREVLKEKAALYAVEAQSNKQEIDEWRSAVEVLFERLSGWLKEADPDGTIEAPTSQIEVTEPGLGRYPISRLNLQAFGKWVGLIPKARRVIRRASPPQPAAPAESTGRVDITNEIRRFVLYRIPGKSGDEWQIDDTAASDGPQPLTPQRFESALLAYFQ